MRYDSTSVPEKYHSLRALTLADTSYWVNLVRAVLPHAASTVMDLGCGTGRFTVPLAEELDVSVIGIDPSQKMLREAARNTNSARIGYREGSAEAIPLEASFVALIFMSHSLHHVKRFDEAVREMTRVLQPNGILFIRNSTIENLVPLYYLQFFPEAMQVCQEMLWPRSTLVERFTAGGFAKLQQGTVHQQAAADFRTYIAKIESRVYSDLALK